jgi:hypothetical protein
MHKEFTHVTVAELLDDRLPPEALGTEAVTVSLPAIVLV